MDEPEIKVGDTLVEENLISATIKAPAGWKVDSVDVDDVEEPVIYCIPE